MKKNFKKISFGIAFVVLMMCMLCFGASAETEGYYVYEILDDEARIIEVDKSISGNAVVPETLGGCPVTEICDWAFSECDNLKTVKLPDCLKIIGNNAFMYCDNLESLEIPDSVTYLGDQALYLCQKLSYVSIGKGVETIGFEVFNNTDLEYILVDKDNNYFTSDEYGVLFDKEKSYLIKYPSANSRTEYTIPDGVVNIEKYALSHAYNINKVVIPDSVKTIGTGAFSFCDNLETITIPNGVKKIEDSTFWCCHSLKEITLPDSLTKIGNNAFWACGLYSITIPANVESIGENAFSECINIEELIVDDNNQFYSNDEYGVLFNKNKTALIKYPVGRYDVTSYKIPYGVENIESYAFSFGYCLGSIDLPDSLITIEEKAFKECGNVRELIIPNSVINIAESAFVFCANLEKVTIGNSVEVIDAYSFVECGNLKYLTLSSSVKYIGVDAFKDCNSMLLVHYLGYKEDFDNVSGIQHTGLYDKEVHYLERTSKEVLPSCKNEGFKANFFCEECNMYFDIYDKVGFTECALGEWTLTREPSLLETGIETSVCSVCGEEQKRELPKKQSDAYAKDENTGISVEYTDGTYEGEVEVVVEPDFDGSQYVALPLEDFTRIASWNIKTYVNGVEVQPTAPVLVSVPLPEGFNSKYIAVYHIDSQTGEFERIKPVYVEDGYVKFLADSFSVYTLVDESSEKKDGIEALFDWLTDLLARFAAFISMLFSFSC